MQEGPNLLSIDPSMLSSAGSGWGHVLPSNLYRLLVCVFCFSKGNTVNDTVNPWLVKLCLWMPCQNPCRSGIILFILSHHLLQLSVVAHITRAYSSVASLTPDFKSGHPWVQLADHCVDFIRPVVLQLLFPFKGVSAKEDLVTGS